jgi:NADPH:quinone reductase-like Zn-dependent oxidoreductase
LQVFEAALVYDRVAETLMRFEIAPRVLITGGACGVGRTCANMLAQMGAELILCDRDAKALASASEALGAVGRFCDVSSEASVTVLAADIMQAYPALDMVINAAGGGYERTLGMYRVSRALLPALRHGEGHNLLVNIPPVDEEGDRAIFPYASSDQAFRRLSSALAAETRGTTIRVLNASLRSGQIMEVIPDPNAASWPDEPPAGPSGDHLEALAWNIALLLAPRRHARRA